MGDPRCTCPVGANCGNKLLFCSSQGASMIHGHRCYSAVCKHIMFILLKITDRVSSSMIVQFFQLKETTFDVFATLCVSVNTIFSKSVAIYKFMFREYVEIFTFTIIFTYVSHCDLHVLVYIPSEY